MEARETTALLSSGGSSGSGSSKLRETRPSDVESEYLSEAEYLEQEAAREEERELMTERRRRTFLAAIMTTLVVALFFVVSTQYGDLASELTHGQFFAALTGGSTSGGSSTSPTTTTTTTTTTKATTTSSSATTKTTKGGDTSTSTSNQPSGTKTVVTTTASGTALESTFEFTMARDGYSELPYFSAGDKSQVFAYKFLEGYDGIVEPSAANTLVLLDDDSSTDDGVYFLYTLCPSGASSSSACYMGSYSLSGGGPGTITVTPECNAYDELSLSVSAYDVDSGELQFSAEGKMMCMYVRREIRALTDADLSATMEAMYTMWVTTDEAGKETYGDNYQSAKYLLEYHFFNAAWQDADHIHEGLGFVAQHIKQSLIFETAMQAVDPSVTLPYWDFTIESATNTSIMFSPIFNDETFGSMPIPADAYWGWTYRLSTLSDAAIPNGRWAFTKTEDNTNFPDLDYSYGYIRAPWNMNPSPYLSRFTSTNKHLPTCSSHYQLLAYDTLTDFLYQVPYGAHASTHGVIGGVYGCDLMDPLMDAGLIIDDEAQINLCKNWIFYLKEFYRMDYLKPRTGCYTDNGDTSYSSMHCGFECNDDYADRMLFDLSKILNSDYDCVPETLTTQQWNTWKDFICVGDGYKIFGGDHLESASPADPSFWPIHPTLERLLQAKYMSGGFTDNTWPTDPQADYICDKPSCFDDATGTFGYWESCCYGHYENDKLLDAPNNNRTGHVGWTNAEIHKATDPTRAEYGMGYVYDSFTWDHCLYYNLDFVGLLEEKYEAIADSSTDSTDTDADTDAVESTTDSTDADADTDSTDADADESASDSTDSVDADESTTDAADSTTTEVAEEDKDEEEEEKDEVAEAEDEDEEEKEEEDEESSSSSASKPSKLSWPGGH